MTEVHDDDLVQFVFGDASPEMAERIRQQEQEGGDLAAKLALMRWTVGVGELETSAVEPLGTRRTGRRRKLLVVVSISLLFIGVVWATWSLLTAPLLKDDFSGSELDERLWRPHPEIIQEGSVQVVDGQVRLVNRGYLITRNEYPGPIEVSLDWKWMQLGLDRSYSDHLTVVLRTTGDPEPKHAFEAQEGILVKFNATSGAVQIMRAGPRPWHTYARTDKRACPMPAGEWRRIRITDDGTTIAVYVSGPSVSERYAKEPILKAECLDPFQKRHVAVYNRELIGFPHESYVDNFLLKVLSKGK